LEYNTFHLTTHLYVQVVVVEFQLLLEGIYDCSWVKMKVEEEEVTVQNLHEQ
jgi:hypothetical protein